MLKLYPVAYTYKYGKEESRKTSDTYYIKGIRGALRHRVMQICYDVGLEVCHTSDKKEDKDGNNLVPAGFHLQGVCKTNGSECIVHQIFGSKGNEGLIAVHAEPITSIAHKTAKVEVQMQNVHIATENRNCMSFDRKPIQDFEERYFSGTFSFEIDVSRCTDEQLGLLVQSVMNLQRIGRGYNTGYGRVKVNHFQLMERTINRMPVWTDDCFLVKEEMHEISLKNEVLNALEAWQHYVARAERIH
ncbi:MAG: RAMP superfamily CRISPR-associated protein [Candidatus Hermodarchaeota archaeon]